MVRGEAYNVKITFLLQNVYWLITKQINTLVIKHLSGFYTLCLQVLKHRLGSLLQIFRHRTVNTRVQADVCMPVFFFD